MFYSDKLVEQAVGMPSVAQIFKVHSEAFFRDNEVMVTDSLLTSSSTLSDL
jgi:shikimate kinase